MYTVCKRNDSTESFFGVVVMNNYFLASNQVLNIQYLDYFWYVMHCCMCLAMRLAFQKRTAYSGKISNSVIVCRKYK